ncbi:MULTISPECIES: ATP-binding protein [unclassified Crossiella]|uniref:ATP-binding protein n=1 Tax=unclassified Crossiella TaxID=2620835 RepID=UPI001FFE7C06|nr:MULTISPECIES: ATP-binding protein [unclassified Crossiella]MCK2240634.1 ATP-binding protein [Crossiella sp. S99.2]MCK2252915.1 ATP-binding protein [Crossiella sp. S99.1]
MVTEALADTRVVLVNGARQVGKSTLTRLTAGPHDAVIRLLDDPATARAAKDDPTGFVEHESLMVIDEIQLAPELLGPIKVSVDLDPTPGRYLLTGSSRILALRTLPDALPGRMEVIELWPFSQGEMQDGPDRFVDAAFQHGPNLDHSSELRRRDYLDRVASGGYPEAVRRTSRRRTAFFDSYLSTLIERDVLELASIERHGDLLKLLALLAGRTGCLLVPATLANQSGIPRTTLIRYLELLSSVFLIKRIPAWSTGQAHRAVGTPKLAFVDTGIACHLLGQDAVQLGEPNGAAGGMMENFVTMELARQLTWSDQRGRLYHYRTKDKVEVDAVIETPDGRVIGIEVKAGATVRTEDLTGLRNLASRLGDRFIAGYVLYTGQQTLPFGEKIKALPLEALWRLAP